MRIERGETGEPDEIAAGLTARLDDPVGVFAAPGRVNLIGEHTDYNAGPCLPIALPCVTATTVGRRNDDRLVATSRQRDERLDVPLHDLEPGSVTGWTAYVAGVAWALRQDGHRLPGLELAVDSTVPVGAGLSSSAALVCSAALAVTAAADLDLEAERLVDVSIRAETDFVGAPTGGMDQTVSLLARSGHALLIDFADHSTRQVPWQPERQGLTLLAIDTRATHELTDGGYAARRADCEAAASALGVDTLRQAAEADLAGLAEDRLRRRARHVVAEIARVGATVDALDAGDWPRVGSLFTASHASLRDDFEVSCPELDAVVETALAHGALGARMTGGGFGGSAIALCREADVDPVVAAVGRAFAGQGWRPPAVLAAPASSGGHRVSGSPGT